MPLNVVRGILSAIVGLIIEQVLYQVVIAGYVQQMPTPLVGTMQIALLGGSAYGLYRLYGMV
jgi:hypothetical protein